MEVRLIIATHLLICSIIQVGSGLNLDFIYAWKSGKKPSANNEITSRTIPITQDYFDLSSCSGSKQLKKNIPIDMIIPMTIFLAPRLRFFSFTRVQHIATSKTESKLHDLNAITIGKLVLATAQVQVMVDVKTSAPHIAEFFYGIYDFFSRPLLQIFPIIQVTRHGTITKIALSANTSFQPVKKFQQGNTILNKMINLQIFVQNPSQAIHGEETYHTGDKIHQLSFINIHPQIILYYQFIYLNQ